jgi:hypothetical protein
VDELHHESQDRRGRPRFVIEYRTLRNRGLGDNEVPARIRLDSLDQLAALLGTTDQITRLDHVIETTQRSVPDLIPWVRAHPLDAVEHQDLWDQLLMTVRWIADHDTGQLDIRHLDVHGADTKFVERHRKILTRLLDDVLPSERIDINASGLASRYGFRRRPSYLRFRLLTPVPELPPVLTELELRTDELAQLDLTVATVFIVENKASYLALPPIPGAMVVFGQGFGVTVLEAVPWLADRALVYWGDIDTHGFAILNRLRERIPSVKSILMDRATLLAHRAQLGTETNPTNAPLACLTAAEQDLYRDLIEDRYGASVRLEQERIRFSAVRRALEPWTLGSS